MLWSLGLKKPWFTQQTQQQITHFENFPFLIGFLFICCCFFFLFTVSEASVPNLIHISLNCITELRFALISFVITIQKWAWTCITIDRYCFHMFFWASASCYFHPNLELFTVQTRLPNKQFYYLRPFLSDRYHWRNKHFIVVSEPQMSDI